MLESRLLRLSADSSTSGAAHCDHESQRHSGLYVLQLHALSALGARAPCESRRTLSPEHCCGTATLRGGSRASRRLRASRAPSAIRISISKDVSMRSSPIAWDGRRSPASFHCLDATVARLPQHVPGIFRNILLGNVLRRVSGRYAACSACPQPDLDRVTPMIAQGQGIAVRSHHQLQR
jgi:hypothetical protein